jgi:hypothetical protein
MKTAVACALVLTTAAGCEMMDDPPSWGGSSTTITTTGFGGTTVGVGGTGGGPFGTYDKPVVKASTPPPAISGGTLMVMAGGHAAAVADPDRDQVVVVDLDAIAVKATIALQKGDEPGRLVDDAAGMLHVVLRGSGVVATIDPNAAIVRSRQALCTNPRGIAYEASSNSVHVACVNGELITLDATSGGLRRQLALDSDLRDIVVDRGRLLVSRFRSAEVLVVEQDGQISARIKPAGFTAPSNGFETAAESFVPAVAWRMVPAPGGGALLSFQEEQTSDVQIRPGGYGGFGCGGIVRGSIAVVRPEGNGWAITSIPGAVLPVDVAFSPDSTRVTLAAAGATPGTSQIVFQPTIGVIPPPADAGLPPNLDPCSGPFTGVDPSLPRVTGQAVAVAYDPSGRLLVQTRDPALVVGDRAVTLPGNVIADTGHELFHLGTQGGLACASCHPEGREDGHTWSFDQLGKRRTQSIGGGLQGTEPFHWGGDMRNFSMLTHEVMSGRMSGPALLDGHVEALQDWIDGVPAWKPATSSNQAAVERGRALFNDPNVACASCHTGAKLTNNVTVDVGTGAAFQVPSLVGLAYRAPYMHSGCAGTLEDRFGACGGDRHGNTASLAPTQLGDLLAYLKSL